MDSHIKGLQEIVAGLENAIGSSSFKTAENVPNPNSSISAAGEVTGGTFATGGDIHDALGGELSSINGALESYGSLDISGGVDGGNLSLESSNIKRAGKAVELMNDNLSHVKRSINERIENIITLQNVLNISFENLVKVVNDSGTEVGVADANNIKYVQDKVSDHLDKEVKELQKILKVHIKPSKETLREVLKKNKSFAALADALGTSYNTDDGSDRLAIAFTNLSNVGVASQKVKDAIKTLNISINDYNKIKNIKDLETTLSKSLKTVSGQNGAMLKLEKILKAMKVLQDNQYQHDKVIECLKDDKSCIKSGRGEESHGGVSYDSIAGADDIGGSAQSVNAIGRVNRSNKKSSLTKSIKTYQNTLKELFKSFMMQIHSNFKEIRTAVDEVSDQIGSNIPYDEKIKNFVNVFEGLNADLDNPKLFYATISLDNSLQSKELKTRFTDNLNKLIESLSDLKSHKYLNEIEKQLKLVKENIDTYSDTVSGVKNTDLKLKEGSDEVSGSNDFFWTNKILDQSVPLNVANLIKETITKLKFYGNVSQLRSNLESTFKEYSGYKEDYDKLLGKSIGTKINELTKEYTENVDRLNDKERGRGWLLEQYNKNAAPDQKVPRGLIETIYKLQYDARVGLYKTIEAIDLYLISFTEQLSGNIEAVKDLNKMLQQTEIISKWFNNDSEKHLQELSNMMKDDLTIPGEVKPFVTGVEIKKVLETCKRSIDSVSMLKNIISMFVHIGDKFGNKALSKDMYMSPSIIYKNLVKYTWVSAFTMNYGTAGGDVNAIIDNAPKKDKNGYEVEKGDFKSFFNLKYITVRSPLDLLSKYEKCMKTNYRIVSGKGIEGGETAEERNERILQQRAERLAPSEMGVEDKDVSDITVDYLINKHLFVNDDKYFILMLKAITSKVLTVIGTSNILKQPANIASMLQNPIRTIIGGAKDPEVIDDAFELYIRLPLLVEFYKNVFENGNDPYKKNKRENNEVEKIAYIPEVGSIWSGLIQCIFDESRYIKDGLYSLDNMKRIILEVNNIYKSYKNVDKKKLVRNAVLDLIADVNKRYGVLKQSEINEFYQIKKKYIRNINDVTDSNNVNFDILDENNEYESSGPSSQYVENTFSKSSSNNYNIVSNDINIVKDFHDKINLELFQPKVDIEKLSKKSFTEKIKFYKNELMHNNNNSSKLDLIVKAIDESSNINSHNDDVNVMFHELVTTPIKNLQAVRNILYTFISRNIPKMALSFERGSDLAAEYVDIVKAINTQLNDIPADTSYKNTVTEFLQINNTVANNTILRTRSQFNKVTLLEEITKFFNDLNNLVDIKFISNNKFVLEFSKLQKNVETSIENVKYMISKFRSQIDKSIVTTHEKCLLDIEDKLLLKILNNDENNDMAFFEICNLNYLNNCISQVLENTKATPLQNDLYKVIMISTESDMNNKTALKDKKFKSALFKDVFAQYQGGNKRLWLTIDDLANTGGASTNNNFEHINSIFNTLDSNDLGRSLLSGFNNLIFTYLTVFYDSSNKKIYNNLFNEFVNKSQSNAIFGNNGVPDILSGLNQQGTQDAVVNIANSAFQYDKFVQNDHVLCESLAYMFKTLVNRTSNIQLPTKNHLVANLSEVSPNVVEKYKVYLPVFIKLFETLIHKSMLFKKVLETTTDTTLINGDVADIILAPFDQLRYIHGDVKGDVQQLNGQWLVGTNQSYSHFNNTINNIVEASRSLINDASSVLAEINHKQQFFEIKENFIKNFYNNTNKLPLMPMSLTTLLLNKDVTNTSKSLMPYNNKPDNEIKFMYGINSIINNKSLDNNINSYIWLKEELKNYNNGSLSINKVEVDKINEYLDVNNKFVVSLSSILYNNKFLDTFPSGNIMTSTIESECNIDTYYSKSNSQPFMLAISSVDSTSVDNNKRLIAKVINNTATTTFSINRSNARLLNILDLNVMPINIHALMREIPLINIYNYAFTYDNIIKQTMGSRFDVDDCTKSPTNNNEVVTALLLDPYYINNNLTKSDMISAIFADNDVLGKGKYMSDMIKNIKPAKDGNKVNILDSKFVRNLIFFTNLQRLITSKIKKEVERINTKVVSDIAIINPKITTYGKENPNYKDDEFDYLMI